MAKDVERLAEAFAADQNAKTIYRLKKDFAEYATRLLFIQTKEGGGLKPFVFNKTQQKLEEIFERSMRTKGYVRLLILKARQFGVTTWVAGHAYHSASLNFDTYGYIITHRMEDTRMAFDKIKIMHENMVEELKPQTRKSNSYEIDMRGDDATSGNRSKIGCLTAGSDTTGRGQTPRFVHGSEVAYWANPERIDLAIQQAMPSEIEAMRGTWIVYESTANGKGNMFHKMWYTEGDDWDHFFIPFFWNEKYVWRVPDPVVWPEGTSLPDWDYWEKNPSGAETKDLVEEELQLSKNPEVSKENLAWRRWMIKNKCGSAIWRFHQEYPATPIEAFVSSGQGYCDTAAIEWHSRLKPPKPPIRGIFESTADYGAPIRFMQYKGGPWILYDYEVINEQVRPYRNQRYAIGGDVAEGSDAGSENTQDLDYSTAYVCGDKRDCTAATYRERSKPNEFGKQLRFAGVWFNGAFIVPEISGLGLAILPELYHNHVYKREELDMKTAKKTKKDGWKTTSATRPPLIALAEATIRERDHEIYDEVLLNEAATIVRDSTGKFQARAGCHDDAFFAFALAMIGRNHFTGGDLKMGKLGLDRKKRAKGEEDDFGQDRIKLTRREM
jgi:hypothetical protein